LSVFSPNKKYLRFCIVFLFVFNLFTGSLFSQVSLEEYLQKTEAVINKAAECWLDKNYTRALDILHKINNKLTNHSFPPTDRFAWEACRSLKTYTIVFSRVVEAKWYNDKGDDQGAVELRKQAKEWAKILECQAYSWSKVKPRSNDDVKLRKKWLKRFSSIIASLNSEHEK